MHSMACHAKYSLINAKKTDIEAPGRDREREREKEREIEREKEGERERERERERKRESERGKEERMERNSTKTHFGHQVSTKALVPALLTKKYGLAAKSSVGKVEKRKMI